jgi:uncharacterized protein (DUF58 family)
VSGTRQKPRKGRAEVVGRRYHFHGGGIAYAITTVILVIGAVNAQNNLLFWLFGVGVAGLIISGLLSGGSLMGLAVERETPHTGTVGDDIIVRYTLHNRSRVFPAYGITIEEIEQSKRGGSSWAGRVTRPVAFASYIPPRGSVVVEARCTGCKRGPLKFGPLLAWTTFPFGLTKKSVTFYQDGKVALRPWVAPVREGALRAASGSGDSGSASRPARTGDEFYSLREFVYGDSLKSVAWRSSARAGHALVREMAVRPSRRVWITLAFGDDERANEQVISVAAGLVTQAARSGHEPGLAVRGGPILEPPRAGRRTERLMDQLAVLETRAVAGGTGVTIGDGSVVVSGSGEVTGPGQVFVTDASIYTPGAQPSWQPEYGKVEKQAPGLWSRFFAALTGGGE